MPKFRLIRGQHSMGKGPALRVFKAGDVIETDTDLIAKFNSPGSQKFELLSDNEAGVVPTDGRKLKNYYQPELPVPEPTVPAPVPHAPVRQAAPVAPQYSEPKPPVVNDKFSNMSVNQLKEHAAAEEIDLGTATRREDILAVIRSAPVTA